MNKIITEIVNVEEKDSACLQQKVNALLKDGYELEGGYHTREGGKLMQKLVRYGHEDDGQMSLFGALKDDFNESQEKRDLVASDTPVYADTFGGIRLNCHLYYEKIKDDCQYPEIFVSGFSFGNCLYKHSPLHMSERDYCVLPVAKEAGECEPQENNAYIGGVHSYKTFLMEFLYLRDTRSFYLFLKDTGSQLSIFHYPLHAVPAFRFKTDGTLEILNG